MPSPVQTWVTGTPITATSLDLALYSNDGTNGNPNGIAFHAYRPLLLESYVTAATLPTTTGGTQTSLAGSALATPGNVVYDTAGYFGQTQDQPMGTGYYQFLAAIKGSAGDGVTPGGWMLLSHFAAVAAGTHLTSVSADLLGTAQAPVSGTRQAPSATQDSTAFFLDLVNVGPSVTWTPAVTVAASSGTASLVVNTTDSSGETCRFCALWAAVSATSAGAAFFPDSVGSPFPWTAPLGVTQVTVSPDGAGGGGGGGASGANEQGGGGGGGGEYASGTINVTPQNTYSVIVGAGGAPGTGGTGTGAGTAGSGGGLSQMAGDGGSQVTAHGGSGGGGATSSANGTGGSGGSGSGASTHHSGGAGAAGKTAVYGGGGGSSAGTSAAGNAATSASGAPAPPGGGPGGAGGTQQISIVQNVHASAAGGTLKVSFKGLQAGNTVICFVYTQAVSATSQGNTVVLSDGTSFGTAVATADVSSNVALANALYSLSGVAGGETSLTITASGSNSGKAILAQVYEVSGLGPSPQIDAQTSHTQGPKNPDSAYESSPSPGISVPHAPDLWVAMTGAQQTSSFTVSRPPSSQGWNTDSPQYVHASSSQFGTIYGALMTASQARNAPGTMWFANVGSPGFSKGVTKGTLAVAFTTSALTAGNAPVIGPGGGGGAGLGAGNGGGAGQDGQVTLSWVAPSGSGYGTPALPAPFTGWTQATTLGTAVNATVNVNGPQGIRDVVNFLSNPPVLRVSQTAATAIPASAITTVPFTSATPSVDSYSGWSGSTYTVQRTGLYLAHGLACFASASTGLRMAAVKVNGITYWGPPSAPASTGTTNAAKTAILGLHAGDTVAFAAYQTTAGGLNLATTDQTRFLLAFLCEIGVPQGNWSPPDTTFRWASGTRGEALGGNLSALLQQHLGGDLGFLVNRPYFTGYQSIAQTGLTQNAFTTVTLDQVQGIIHGADNGDNYNGWSASSNAWTAPEPGWFLCVGEVFASAPSTTGCTVTAALLPTTSGGASPSQAPDIYQALQPSTSFGGGAALVAMQYLSQGESLSLQVRASGYSSSYSTLVGTHSGGTTVSALSLVWMSE